MRLKQIKGLWHYWDGTRWLYIQSVVVAYILKLSEGKADKPKIEKGLVKKPGNKINEGQSMIDDFDIVVKPPFRSKKMKLK